MAIVQLGGNILYPDIFPPSYNNSDMNGTNLRYAWAFRVPRTGNIDRIAFHTGSTAVTSQSIDIQLETFSTDVPSGTLYGGSAAAVLASVAATTNYEVTLATPAAATVGDDVWVVFKWTSTAGVVAIAADAGGSFFTAYRAIYTSSWAKGVVSRGMIGIRYDDGNYYPTNFVPPGVSSNTTFTNGSNPDERGLKISLPFEMEVVGLFAYIDADNVCDLTLYDSVDTVIDSIAIDPNIRGSTTAGYYVWQIAPVTLPVGDYRLTIKPTSGSNVTVRPVTLHNAATRGAFSGGTNVCGTSRVDAGSWTDSDTTRYSMGLLVAGIDSGGSGGFVPHSMAGRFGVIES